MSQWTHVNFMAEVGTGRFFSSKTALKEQVESELDGMDKAITGSEGGVDWHVYVPKNCDSMTLSNGSTTYLWGTAIIVCHGHLRDRTKEETSSEIQQFVDFLKRHFTSIRNLTYAVYADGEEYDWYKSSEKEEQ